MADRDVILLDFQVSLIIHLSGKIGPHMTCLVICLKFYKCVDVFFSGLNYSVGLT